jgi:hypothetical protein
VVTDTIDKLLEMGSAPDFITPLWAMIQDILHAPAHHIYIDRPSGISAAQVERALKSKGVRVWGVMIVDKSVVMSVRKPQARYAVYWLHRWGLA